MARDDEAREGDETTVIAGGNAAWSAVERPAEIRGPGDEEPAAEFAGSWQPQSEDDAPTTMIPTVLDSDPGPYVDADLGSGPQTSGVPRAAIGPGDDLGSDADRDGGPIPPVEPPAPVLVAKGLGLLTKSGWVFKDIDLTLRPASVAAIVGPSGTGRSCLLLALSGRMDANTGTLTVAGHNFADKPGQIRSLTAVARISSVAGPEPGLTVRESIDERCLIEDVNATIGRTRFEEACAALQVTFDPKALTGTLVGDQATLFAIALACVRVSAVIVLDDLDRGVSAAMQQVILDALIRLAKTGPTIIVSTTDRIPVMEADVVLDLTPKEGATVWRFEPVAAPPGMVLRQIEAAPGDQPEERPGDRPDDHYWAAPELDTGSLTPPPPPEPIDQDEPGPGQTDDAPTEDNR
jgi:ABC-type branched-subunit amino acid transport system ATPase component